MLPHHWGLFFLVDCWKEAGKSTSKCPQRLCLENFGSLGSAGGQRHLGKQENKEHEGQGSWRISSFEGSRTTHPILESRTQTNGMEGEVGSQWGKRGKQTPRKLPLQPGRENQIATRSRRPESLLLPPRCLLHTAVPSSETLGSSKASAIHAGKSSRTDAQPQSNPSSSLQRQIRSGVYF